MQHAQANYPKVGELKSRYLENARTLLTQAIEKSHKLGLKPSKLYYLTKLAEFEKEVGNQKDALTIIDEAIELCKTLNKPSIGQDLEKLRRKITEIKEPS